MLKKLVLSIKECSIDKALIKDINIIIVDNDIDKTAETIVNEIKEGFDKTFKLFYLNNPIKGLSNVRNELLKYAFLFNPDFLVFIDDDEYVTTEWLNELVKTINNNNGDAARGPVLANIDETIPTYISCWFKRESYPDNFQINSLTTGNLIIKLSSLKRYNVWFDSRFDKTGAEDCYFGIQIIKRGATIYWAEKAVAYETIPKSRANIKWLIKRYYNGANTYTYILKLEKSYFKLFKKTLISLIYIFSGICATIIVPLPIKRKYWGLLKFSEGIGGIAGLLSIKYYAYK